MGISKINILVTGGSGFLGKALMKELTSPYGLIGVSTIRIFDLKRPAEISSDGKVEN
jgi:nucleoside-diphosphate-sugar epimerase